MSVIKNTVVKNLGPMWYTYVVHLCGIYIYVVHLCGIYIYVVYLCD